MLFREVPGHYHGMTFGNIKFHLPIGLPLGKGVQVILHNLAINGGFNIPIKHTIISKEAVVGCPLIGLLPSDVNAKVCMYSYKCKDTDLRTHGSRNLIHTQTSTAL